MDSNHITILVALILLMLLSAFFSASETAFSTVNKVRLKAYVKEKNKKAKAALEIAENFDRTIFAILIGNNIVNIASSTLAAVLMMKIFGESGAFISTVMMTIIVITFGEIIPKSLAKEYSEKFSIYFVSILKFIIVLCSPLIFVFLKLKKLINKFSKNNDLKPSVTEQELKHIVEDIEEEGVLEKQESEMVKCALEFDEKSVGNILTPRVNMVTIEVKDSEEKIKNIIFNERYSRIPVCRDSIDNIIGVLHTRDYLEALALGKKINIKEIIKPCYFAYESKELSSILSDFKYKKIHLAIVVDNYGGTLGMVTMEDLLEEIVGDIWDEDEEAEEKITIKDDGTYETTADVDFKKLLRFTGIEYEKIYDNYSTLGSFIVKTLGKMPEKDEKIKFDNFQVIIKEVTERRIGKVVIQKSGE